VAPTADPQAASPEEQAAFREGVRLFNDCRYFDAHDVWEEIWAPASGRKRLFYQGLIHAAVTLEHYLRGNPRGVQGVWRMTRDKLAAVEADCFMGLHLKGFLAAVEQSIQPALDAPVGKSLLQRDAALPFDRAQAPQIVLHT
jgi:hypothetical protein